TAQHGARRGGLVATQVMPATIDPQHPLVMVALAHNHFTHELVIQARCFGLHLVARDQLALAWPLAIGSGRDHDKLAGMRLHAAQTGAPLMGGTLAWFDCRTLFARAIGERTYFWAQIVAAEANGNGPAATDADLVQSATPQQLAQLR